MEKLSDGRQRHDGPVGRAEVRVPAREGVLVDVVPDPEAVEPGVLVVQRRDDAERASHPVGPQLWNTRNFSTFNVQYP